MMVKPRKEKLTPIQRFDKVMAEEGLVWSLRAIPDEFGGIVVKLFVYDVDTVEVKKKKED